MSRGVGAVLVAAVMVLSGCASATEDVTTTSTSPETPVNPWDLPLEERPDLFDPCAEIPVAAIEEALGGPVSPDEAMRNHQPNELHTCGWSNDEVLLAVTGTWRSKQGFLTHTGLVQFDTESVIHGRSSYRARDRNDSLEDTCYQVFFTSRGSVVVNVNLIGPLSEFRGSQFADGCDVLDQIIAPITQHLPEEDY